MDRRELLKGTALGALATQFLAPALAEASQQAGAGDSESARAMAELQQAITELDRGFSDPAWRLRSPADFAEAQRMLLHTLLHALQLWFEADPARPFFRSFIDEHKKMLGDNPDARYHSAVIDDRHRYRIFGNVAGATYTSFTLELGVGDESRGVGSTLNDTQFTTDAEGNYEIFLSREKMPGNWMSLTAGTRSITTRHYYERKTSIGREKLHVIPIAIENLDDPGPRPRVSDATVAAGIRRVAEFLRRNVIRMDASNSPAWVSQVPNRFNPPVVDATNEAIGYAAVDNAYAMAPFLLQPHQALVIRGRFPKARFASVLLHNQFLQSFDYETRTISLNRRQMVYEPDGSFKVVVAHRDPGMPNWLDTEGRPFGLVFWRFLLPEEPLTPLATEVIELG
jgi:hypothetical protein